MGLARAVFGVTATALAISGLAACGGSLASNNDAGGGDAGSADAPAAADAHVSDAPMVPPAFQNQLDVSAAAWLAMKPSCPTYSYVRVWRSVFGAGGETSIEIRDDIPTRRRYVVEPWFGPDAGAPATWEETGAAIGSHSGGLGVYPALTVEQLYAECQMVLARDPNENELRLAAWTSGALNTCTFTPKGCADDCTSGIMIHSFACAPLPAAE